MAPLQFEAYTLDPRPYYPLVVTAKRYWSPTHQSLDPDALTVICAHATGYHKEHWEPTIEDLFDVLTENGTSNVIKIREFWSIDCPNHGDGGVLNEETLSWGHTPVFDWQEYSRAIHAFVAGLGTGVDINFQTRRLVGFGHSMGGSAIVLSDTYMPKITYESIFLVDPMFYRRTEANTIKSLPVLSGKRRDVWPTYEEAYKQFSSRPAYQVWDPRILKLYVKYGLRDLPTLTYPDKEGVTLKCTKEQEVACYLDVTGKSRAYAYVHNLCARMPVHFIFGGANDIVPREIHEDLLKNAARGMYASVARVEGAGHLVVQYQPRRLAEALHAALLHNVKNTFVPGARTDLQSKL
ncbi:alpha/beta-hydrolase [Trametopsis cervina]|nr:alpha/beta-hydrolase [Trametopsis cervina]